MPFPFLCRCSSSFQPTSQSPTTTATTSSSSGSSAATRTTSSSSDTLSIQTHPSLPLLHSLLPSYSPTAVPSNVAVTVSLLISFNLPPSPTLSLLPSSLFAFTQTSVCVFDLTALRQELSIRSLSAAGAVKSAVISPSSSTIFSAHQDGKIRAWSSSLPKLRLKTSLPTLSDRLHRLPLASNYVTVRRNHSRLWIEHADAVSALAISTDFLYSVSWDKTMKIWRLSDLKCLETLITHDDAVNAVAVAPDGTVYTGSADRKIKVWARSPGSGHRRRHVLVATLVRHKSAVNALAVSGDGTVLYSGACDRSVLVWEREESASFMICSGVLRGHARAIMCLSTVGIDLVASGSTDRTVRIWRRGGGGEGYSCLCVLEGHVRGVRSVVVEKEEVENEEAYRVCSGSVDGEVRIWRVRVESKKSPI